MGSATSWSRASVRLAPPTRTSWNTEPPMKYNDSSSSPPTASKADGQQKQKSSVSPSPRSSSKVGILRIFGLLCAVALILAQLLSSIMRLSDHSQHVILSV